MAKVEMDHECGISITIHDVIKTLHDLCALAVLQVTYPILTYPQILSLYSNLFLEMQTFFATDVSFFVPGEFNLNVLTRGLFEYQGNSSYLYSELWYNVTCEGLLRKLFQTKKNFVSYCMLERNKFLV